MSAFVSYCEGAKAYTLEKWQGQILYFNEEIKKLKEDRRMIVEAVLLNFLNMTIFYAIPMWRH